MVHHYKQGLTGSGFHILTQVRGDTVLGDLPTNETFKEEAGPAEFHMLGEPG